MELKGKAFWNCVAQDYALGRTQSRKTILDPEVYRLLRDVEGKRILDVACGAGVISIHLAEFGAKCTGVDYSENLIKIAKLLYRNF